jgi:hypothetical protein
MIKREGMELQSNVSETVSASINSTSTLMMEAKTDSELFDHNSILTWLITQEDFITNYTVKACLLQHE